MVKPIPRLHKLCVEREGVPIYPFFIKHSPKNYNQMLANCVLISFFLHMYISYSPYSPSITCHDRNLFSSTSTDSIRRRLNLESISSACGSDALGSSLRVRGLL
jgi:hypothetical protein